MAVDPEELLLEAEEEIEAWCCELDAQWRRILADAADEADRVRAEALGDAAAIVGAAREEAHRILAEADELAGEHVDVIRALNAAEREAVGEELAGLRRAVDNLRSELSRLVDAAFDALPAMEATSEAIDRALGDDAHDEDVAADEVVPEPGPEPEPVPAAVLVAAAPPRRRLLRRLLRR